MTHTTRFRNSCDETGASLILAIVFLVAIALVLVSVGGLTSSSLVATNNLKSLRATETNAETAAILAIRTVRTTYTSTYLTASPVNCSPAGTPTTEVVYCEGSAPSSSYFTRVVDFYVCTTPTLPPQTTGAQCVSGPPYLYLHATVQYSDFNFAGVKACSATTTATCGTQMNILTWDIPRADG